ncbi:MAG: hypothetical protein WC793_02590 [Candidatus Paceibacterota bacterium]|jgi:hypothetical protein
MNTYKNEVPSYKREKINPIQEEIAKNVGTYNLTAIIEEDKETVSKLKNIPNLICFLCTLKIGNEIIGVGRGSANLNRMNRGIERGVRYSFGNSIVDAVVRGIKNLDALYFKTTNQPETKIQNEVDLEGRDKQSFFNDEDMPQEATDKQRNFLTKLVEKCDEEDKEEYLDALASPYLSKFQCSELIQKLMPMK